VINSVETYPDCDVNPRQAVNFIGGNAKFQDPYRRDIFAVDKISLDNIEKKIDACVKESIEASDVIIITLGLVESWRDISTGRFVCSGSVPIRSSNRRGYEFVLTDFNDNYENLLWVCNLLRKRYKNKEIVLTVSPVPLHRTFTTNDVVTANMYSKSVLRAVAGKIEAEFDSVHYWPSFEIASKMDLYKEDGRHVTEEGISFIVENFLKAYTVKID